eukprot:TRINITY_DN3216_c0_g1_i2.p1 TRINITY_DN3216_c0_g1~~TRINITY_DN3216_c0_g1_i2.p1  ORF type:complete len:318 (-),score=28.78 TRINITY_DN3216_c0_g1_i2:80-1033(-)
MRVACVTGAGGFIASWIVKYLLDGGYSVRGTLRNPNDEKNSHLQALNGAKERLKLFKADVLAYESVLQAIDGCDTVFHTACPVPSRKCSNPDEELVKPAVGGTLNVLKACSVSNVRRVIFTSSVSAVRFNRKIPDDKVLDESCWSDPAYCRETESWYLYAKTVSEQKAWEFCKEKGIHLVSLCPSLVLGPLLQKQLNFSSSILLKLVNGETEKCENTNRNCIDVRDVAKAHILAAEVPSAHGRYLCTCHFIDTKGMVDILSELYPQYDYPKEFVDTDQWSLKRASCSRLRQLGMHFIPLEQTLKDTVESFRKLGYLN